jgi:hypothetical protein
MHGDFGPEVDNGGHQLFWYHVPTGRRGAGIEGGMWRERLFGESLVYLADGPCRYNLRTGELVRIDVALEDAEFLSNHELLTRTPLGGEEWIVKVNLRTLAMERLAQLPEHLRKAERIGLAGEDGVYVVTGFIDGFSLWYCPRGKAWRPVVKDVHVFKTFGGMPPWLPVQYLGNDRFAVAKTTRDEVEGKRDGMFPQAASLTLLIDGLTGERIDQSEEVIYDQNPPLNLKDGWMSAAAPPPEPEPTDGDGPFRWIASEKAVEFGEGKKISTGKDDLFRLSHSGRYLLIYRRWSSDWGEEARHLKFTILDGRTGEVREKVLRTELKTIFVGSLSWLAEEGDSVEKADLEAFERGPLDPFRDPGAF